MAGKGHTDIFAQDIEWREGSTPEVLYKLFQTDSDNPSGPMIVLSKFEPHAQVEPHTHDSNYFEYIIEGEQTVGKTCFRAGDVRIVKGGTGYGPITVGPDGCTVIIVFENGTGANVVSLSRRKAS